MRSGKLKIVLAQTAGFCMGVRRAMKMALDAANDPQSPAPIGTVGPLIHNNQVLRLLESKGVKALEEHEPSGGTALIRAHGVSPEKKRQLAESFEKVVDATCPHVRRVQRIAEKYARSGYECVIVGDRGHAEVESVLSCAPGHGHVVGGPDEVRGLPDAEKVAVVAQTTQNADTFNRTVAELRKRWPDCKVFNTICRSTQFRQAEVAALAQKVDVMVVVGGYHSANTRRLAQISAATGTPTLHVETDAELDLDRLLQFQSIGVTAGASTPNWMIRRVIRRLRREHHRRNPSLGETLRSVLAGPIHSNVFVGGGAALLTFANCLLMGIPYLWVCSALAFFFILAQHLLNQYVKRDVIYLNDPDKAEFFRLNERPLLFLGVCSMAAALLLGLFLGWASFALVALGTAAGVLYWLGYGGWPGRRIGIGSLRQIPGSKELFVGLAWAVTTALIPGLVQGNPATHWRQISVAILLSFLLGGQRTLMTDLRDVEGDQLMGRETMAVALGESRAKVLFILSMAGEAVLLGVLGGAAGWASPFSYMLLPLVPYAALYFLLFHFRRLPEGEIGEALIDGKFYFCGLLAALWAIL